jgi:uncharacterized membrane protein YccC
MPELDIYEARKVRKMILSALNSLNYAIDRMTVGDREEALKAIRNAEQLLRSALQSLATVRKMSAREAERRRRVKPEVEGIAFQEVEGEEEVEPLPELYGYAELEEEIERTREEMEAY